MQCTLHTVQTRHAELYRTPWSPRSCTQSDLQTICKVFQTHRQPVNVWADFTERRFLRLFPGPYSMLKVQVFREALSDDGASFRLCKICRVRQLLPEILPWPPPPAPCWWKTSLICHRVTVSMSSAWLKKKIHFEERTVKNFYLLSVIPLGQESW